MSNKHYRPVPADFLLLELLPEKGMIGGLHWKGRQVNSLVTEINEGLSGGGQNGLRVSSGFIQARLRSMHVAGFVSAHPASGGNIWARTPAGADYLGMKEKVLNA